MCRQATIGSWLLTRCCAVCEQDDKDLQMCIWITCRQREANPGAYLTRTGMAPEGICQLKCKPHYCAFAEERLASGEGYLGCVNTHLSTGCAEDTRGPELGWILPVIIGCVAVCMCGVAAMFFFRLVGLRRTLRSSFRKYLEEREARKALVQEEWEAQQKRARASLEQASAGGVEEGEKVRAARVWSAVAVRQGDFQWCVRACMHTCVRACVRSVATRGRKEEVMTSVVLKGWQVLTAVVGVWDDGKC